MKHRVARLIVLNQIVSEGPALPVPQGRVNTILGSINQYTLKKGNSSCTACAQCFLARTLPKGTACSIQTNEIDKIVQDGYSNFDLLLGIKNKEAHVSGIFQVAQAMDTNECSEIYGLQVLSAVGDKDKRILVRGEDGTTKGYFRNLLQEFQESLRRRNALGAVIHSQGKTYALALFRNSQAFEWALFDSHGYPDDGKAHAYIKHTDSLEAMVQCLSELIEYKACDVEDLSSEDKERIESDNNDFIFYVVEHQDHELFAEPYEFPPVPEEGNPVPEKVDEEIVVEPKKIEEELPVAAESSNIERRVALYLLIIATLGVSYRVYRNRIMKGVTIIPSH